MTKRRSSRYLSMKLILLITSLLLLGCSPTHEPAAPAKVKNIILLIGDGMGPAQFGLLETYARRAPNSIYGERPTAVSQLMQQGKTLLSDTGPHNALVVDSACSATQLAIGQASGSEMIGLDARGARVDPASQPPNGLGEAPGELP